VYADLINFGDPYKENASKFSDIKFNIKTAISLERAELTIGDFIAHILPINNFENIENTITQLIGDRFSEKLEIEIINSQGLQQTEFICMLDNEVLEKDYKRVSEVLAVQKPQKIYRDMIRDVQNVFEMRHKLCHEGNPIMTDEDVGLMLSSPEAVLEFLVVSESVLDKLLSQRE
jgi:hypothetical protein